MPVQCTRVYTTRQNRARNMDGFSSKSQQTRTSSKSKMCPHGYQSKSNCKRCSPQLVCEHNLFKRRCVACTGGCEHGKKPYSCMTCNPNLTCVHGVWKYACPTCNYPKPKNSAEFKKVSCFTKAKIIRAKACCQEQFTHSVKKVTTLKTLKLLQTKQDIKSAGITPYDEPYDEPALSFCTYQLQSAFAKALWTYDDTK